MQETEIIAATASSPVNEEFALRRFGMAQVWAGLLLLIFAAQGFWLLRHTPVAQSELEYAQTPVLNGDILSPGLVSPITSLAAHVAARVVRPDWGIRLPFLMIGVLLGASVWYIARRLYGNAGGFIALTLYAFSPSMIAISGHVQPEIIAAWGIFGCVFTAIAVAHTLYAPRNAIRWNWKRITLLGALMGIGAAAQLSSFFAIFLGLAFMLYLAPGRRAVAVAVVAASSLAGLVVFATLHGFRFGGLLVAAGLTGGFTLRMLAVPAVWQMVGVVLLHNSPGFVLLLALSLATLAGWRRPRFFGNLAPLLVALVLIGCGLVFPYAAGFTFILAALPFLFVLTAGVCADLLESGYGALALGMVSAALLIHAIFSLHGLWQVGR